MGSLVQSNESLPMNLKFTSFELDDSQKKLYETQIAVMQGTDLDESAGTLHPGSMRHIAKKDAMIQSTNKRNLFSKSFSSNHLQQLKLR